MKFGNVCNEEILHESDATTAMYLNPMHYLPMLEDTINREVVEWVRNQWIIKAQLKKLWAV